MRLYYRLISIHTSSRFLPPPEQNATNDTFIYVLLLATHCMTASDCGDLTCGHGEYAACELVHGSGGGSGEMQCVCKHHKKRGNLTPFHTQLTMISLALISLEAEHWLVRYIWKAFLLV